MRFTPVLALALLACASANAQTVVKSDSFTFTTHTSINRYTVPPTGGSITSWDGVDCSTACPYPGDMGGIAIAISGGYGSAINVPFQLGYLNNGDLSPCDPITNWSPRTFTVGDGTHSGDVFTVTGSTTCPYFTGEYGTYDNSNNRLEGFSVTASYTVFKYMSCYRGRCGTVTEYFLTGGSGMVTDSLINQ